MTPTQLPLALAQRHQNRQLFSDHYLDHTLPQRPAWRDLAAAAAPLLTQLTQILAAYVPSANEAQTEQDLVRPVLAALGHTFEVQAALKTPKGTKKPDYVFYRDQAALHAHKGVVLDDARLAGQIVAVGDAKYWDRPLDVSLKLAARDADLSKVPSDQIAFYMLHSGAPWGILTNGRRWRLYHRDTAQKQDRFYEVDLPALVASGDPGALVYFSAFFHRSAFDDQNPLGLDALLKESRDYAQGISTTLKTQVYDALRELAQGFLDAPGNALQPDAATLAQIYDHSLIVLYRLLFILYAEARELLPLRASAAYRTEYSLYAITREAARRMTSDAQLLPTSSKVWAQLVELFHIINAGSPPLQVATFNGGLFDPHKYPFLEQHRVGDARLVRAIDKLARVGGQFIDYRDLAERHLGTIYEGLLEHHLQAIAPEGGWTVDLFNDQGERHRTGSYYTPDFVVQYIVDQTLRPVLDAAVAGKTTDAAQIAAVLAVTCLDPAMGSGHFPVAAMEYIARYLVELGVTPETDAGGEADLAYWKRRVAQNCIYGVDLNPLAVDLAKLSLWLATAAKGKPLSFLDHHLRCGNALIGVRVAALDTGRAAKKKPTKKTQQAVAAGQISMLDDPDFARSMEQAVGAMWQIEETAGDTIAEVRAQERLYADLRAVLTRKYGKLADVAAARDFGLNVDATFWKGLMNYLTTGGFDVPQFAAVLKTAAAQAADQRFFHWDLEFPEVFFDRQGQPLGAAGGFDVVMGNPPYVRQEQLAPLKPYFAQVYLETYAGTADLYVYFVNQGLRVLRQRGRLSYIASNSWLRANYAGPLRNFLRTQATVEQLIDLGDNRVFADAPDVYPAILVARRDQPADDHTAQVAVFSRGEGVKQFAQQVEAKLAPVSVHDQADTGWQLGDNARRQVLAKLLTSGRSLEEVTNGRLYRGIMTGFNDAFIIDQQTYAQLIAADPHSQELLKPSLRGEDLRPWYQEDEGRWLILSPWDLDIAQYPAIQEHLLRWKPQLEARPECQRGVFNWWCLSRYGADYVHEFENTKIFWPDIARSPRFSWDDQKQYINNKGYIIATDDRSLLGILQSHVVWYVISQLCTPLGERAGSLRYQHFMQFMVRLPIPDAPAAERENIGNLAMNITTEARARYELHRRAQRRILADLGTPGGKLNQKLTAWWALDFPSFRAEIQKVFKQDIPLKDRDDWSAWLDTRRLEHQQRTEAIVRMETDLNARVYALFDLTSAEITIIEESTKYRYGEV